MHRALLAGTAYGKGRVMRPAFSSLCSARPPFCLYQRRTCPHTEILGCRLRAQHSLLCWGWTAFRPVIPSISSLLPHTPADESRVRGSHSSAFWVTRSSRQLVLARQNATKLHWPAERLSNQSRHFRNLLLFQWLPRRYSRGTPSAAACGCHCGWYGAGRSCQSISLPANYLRLVARNALMLCPSLPLPF